MDDVELKREVEKIHRRLKGRLDRAKKHVKKAHFSLKKAEMAFFAGTAEAKAKGKYLSDQKRRALLAKIDRAQRILTEKLDGLIEVAEEHESYFRIVK
jgi:hypothetical protein